MKDPLAWQIANEGVSSNNVEDLDTLRYALETFVCQGEYQPGDEAGTAPGFVNLLADLARSAGGKSPAPAAPRAPEVTALQGLSGNDLLFGLHEKADVLTQRIADWKVTAGASPAAAAARDLPARQRQAAQAPVGRDRRRLAQPLHLLGAGCPREPAARPLMTNASCG